MDLNKITLIGNVVANPTAFAEPREMATFAIATRYQWTDGKTKTKKHSVDFHRCIAYGKLAEIIGKYIKKGSKLYVEGRSTMRFPDEVGGPVGNGSEERQQVFIIDQLIMLGNAGPKGQTT